MFYESPLHNFNEIEAIKAVNSLEPGVKEMR
jgi:hypothetical protein